MSAIFSSKDNSKELKCRPLQFLFGALRVKYIVEAYRGKGFTCSHGRQVYPGWLHSGDYCIFMFIEYSTAMFMFMTVCTVRYACCFLVL